MDQRILKTERDQLLKAWQKFASRIRASSEKPYPQIQNLCDCQHTAGNGKQIDSYLRQIHDKMGYMAKGEIKNGGLCSGAIYRTEAFINTRRRIGARVGKTIHMEHTVPISSLRCQIQKGVVDTYDEMLPWILKHSVTTAFKEGEQKYLEGYHSSTNAFDPASPEMDLPFARYKKLFANGEQIWNVFDGKDVDTKMHFEEHEDIVNRLIGEAASEFKK